MTRLSTAIYRYLLTGHKPISRNPSVYRTVGILGNLLFQAANLAASFTLHWIWKRAPQFASLGPPDSNAGTAGTDDQCGLVGVLVTIPLGILLIVASCYVTDLFYIVGIIGYGMIVLALSAALTLNSPLTNVTNETEVP